MRFRRTLGNLRAVDPGFDPRGLAVFRIDAHAAGYAPEELGALPERIRDRLLWAPGVRAATLSSVALLAGVRSSRTISMEGHPVGLVAAGTLLGVPAAYTSSRLVESLLFGVSRGDLPTYGAVVGVLFAVALLASAPPARRATQLSPLAALRDE